MRFKLLTLAGLIGFNLTFGENPNIVTMKYTGSEEDLKKIENALKYSKDTVTVDVTEDAVLVVDKGVGIGKKDVDKVTKKFYRSGTHSWDNSMGLGLSIVKAILSMHQSTLEIESIKDKGSTFSFKI